MGTPMIAFIRHAAAALSRVSVLPRCDLGIGNLVGVVADPFGFFMRSWLSRGDVALLRFGPVPYLHLNDPDGVRHVLVDNARNYRKSRTYRIFRPLLGNGLLVSEGASWLRQRKTAQPAFHHARVAAMADDMARAVAELLDEWAGVAEVDMHAQMMRLTLRITGRSLFGLDLAGEERAVSAALHTALTAMDARARSVVPLPLGWPTPSNRRFRSAVARLDAVVARIVKARRVAPGGGHDLLGMLIEADQSAPPGDRVPLRDEVMTLLLAANETTAGALSWALYLLARHPDAEATVLAEVASVLGARAPTACDYQRLTFTRAVVSEALRLHPPVWKIEREAIADDTVAGRRIRAGTIVGITLHTLHRHPRHWTAPDCFMPERFLGPGSGGRVAAPTHKFAYIPFAAGPRQCVGAAFASMEATIALAMIVRAYRVSLPSGHVVAIDPAVTLRPKDGLPMRLARRGAVG